MRRILNLGAGVQSTTVLLMSCRGELPKLDAAVFADTGWEPRPVYRHFGRLREIAREAGIPVTMLCGRNIRRDALGPQSRGRKSDGQRWASMPYYTLGHDGSRGMIRRQCTSEYKIRPIDRWLKQDLLGLPPRKRLPAELIVEQWFGISADEERRARMSPDAWRIYDYPLIDLGMTRQDCLDWCESNGFDQPPRSACVGCPFRHNREWRWLQEHSPEDWRDAVEFDRAIRKCGGMRGDVFLHADRVPLDEIDLRTRREADADSGQQFLFQDCMGNCGV